MNARYLASACILAGGLLVKFGAPLPTVAAGVAIAAIWSWKRDAISRALLSRSR